MTAQLGTSGTGTGRRRCECAGDVAAVALLLGLLILDFLYCPHNPRVIPWRTLSATIYEAQARSLPLLTASLLYAGCAAEMSPSAPARAYTLTGVNAEWPSTAMRRSGRVIRVEPNGHWSVEYLGWPREHTRSD